MVYSTGTYLYHPPAAATDSTTDDAHDNAEFDADAASPLRGRRRI